MGLHRILCFVLLETFLESSILCSNGKKLNGFEFPVYTTEVCPRNQTEWNARSSAINCTENNGYICVPNKELTELLEFCYTQPFIWIQEDICLYLVKRLSRFDAYNCSGFRSGCPSNAFVSSKLFEYPNCTSIRNGCFEAETSCTSKTATSTATTTDYPQSSSNNVTANTQKMHLEETTKNIYGHVLIGILLGIYSIILFIFCMLIILQRKDVRICRRNIDKENIEEYENKPFLPGQPGLDSIQTVYIQDEEEVDHENGINKFVHESILEKNIFEQWQNENKFFIQTKAFKEVEKLINSQNLVIVGGNSGSGKSAIIQNIALTYRSQGWIVIPIYKVQEIINVFNKKKELSNETLFVFNDPIGKDTFDAIEFNEWEKNEERLRACLKNVKLLLTCRKYILSDNRVKGLLKEKAYNVDINDEQLKLDNQEKQNIYISYSSSKKLSKEELTDLVQIEAYFPLLCKLYFTHDKHQREGLRFFKEPFAFLEKELRTFRISYIEKYFALVLLVLFDNVLNVKGIERDNTTKEKFKHALSLCGMDLKTPPSFIGDILESLDGSFVKKIGNTFQFLHDFVMEVTIYVFGSDYPADIIQYADIGFIRRRVKLGYCNKQNTDLSIYIEDKDIDDLGKRLFTEIFGERLLDVVLNPTLKNEKVMNIFINQLENSPKKYKSLLEKKVLQIEKQELYKATKHLFFSKLAFLDIGNGVSPLCALIVFSHTQLSLQCVKVLKRTQEDINDIALFSAACCSGSLELFKMFLKDQVKILLTKQWGKLYPIHVVSAYHNPEILSEMIQFGLDVNLKTDKDGNTPLIYAAGNDTKDYIEDNLNNEISSEERRNRTVNRLLKLKADIDLCNKKNVTPLYIASYDGHNSTVELLLSKGANIDLCDKDGASPLCISCQNGHVSTVEILLRNKADIHLCKTSGASPLFAACENRHDSIIQLLLDNGANINLCENQGFSPLSIACKNGHDSTVRLLLDNGADVNLCEKQGFSPLHIACQNGHNNIVQMLLNKSAEIHLCEKEGASSLYIACRNGHENIVHTLIEKGAYVNKCENKGASPLYIACQNGHDNIVDLLISKGADINLCEVNGASPLHIACQNGHNSTIHILLKKSANINLLKKNGASPLSVACESGHLHSIKLLLSNKANINLCAENGASPLYIACQNGHVKTVEHLLKNEADINLCAKNGSSPLFIACENGHEKTVEILLNQGANIEQCNTKGCSSLYTACENGYDKIVQLLLSKGANINLCEKQGVSLLYIASKNGYEKTVRLLLEKGSNVNLCEQNGFSPLHIASNYKHDSTVTLLLNKGADINLCAKYGDSPLSIACQNGSYSTVKILLSKKADINLCTNDGSSPLFIACYFNHYNTVQLLLNNGANINLCPKHEISPLSVCFVCKNSDIDKTFFQRDADTLHKYGCAFGFIFFYCDDKDNENKLFLFHKKNYKDSIIGPDSYDSLFAFCQVEEMFRMFVKN